MADNDKQVQALWKAVSKRGHDQMRRLLASGVSADAPLPLKSKPADEPTAGRTDAALEIAETLLLHGANPNDRDKGGRSILAAARGKAMKALLVEHGAR